MSRIGRRAIAIPAGVTVEPQGATVRVKGPKGTLTEPLPRGIAVAVEGGNVKFTRPDDSVKTRALHGLARALVANMVRGVVEPFVKELEIQGVGYRADVSGKTLNLLLGFSHPALADGILVQVVDLRLPEIFSGWRVGGHRRRSRSPWPSSARVFSTARSASCRPGSSAPRSASAS